MTIASGLNLPPQKLNIPEKFFFKGFAGTMGSPAPKEYAVAITKDELYTAVKEHRDVGVAFENAVDAAIKVETEPSFFKKAKLTFSVMQRGSELLTAFGKAADCRRPASDMNCITTIVTEEAKFRMMPKETKFKTLLKELQIGIAAEVMNFSRDVKSRYKEEMDKFSNYPSLPSLEPELNEMLLNIGALSFFLHVLDRSLFRQDNEILRASIYDNTAAELSGLFGKMIGALKPELAATAADNVRDLIDQRSLHLAKAPSIIPKDADDTNNVVWFATRAISEDVDHPEDLMLDFVISNRLLMGLINLTLRERIMAMK